MEYVLRGVNPKNDSYMSQALFSRPDRRALSVAWLTHAYIDLDLYTIPSLKEYKLDQIIGQITDFCRDDVIPLPSYIIFSGRGLYLKWAWSNPVPKLAVGRAVAVNKALVKRFARWGADPRAVDVSRILRVVGTTNSRSGEVARVIWMSECGGAAATYDFEMFADEVLPYSMAEISGFREERGSRLTILGHERAKRAAARERTSTAICWADWHWKVLCDIELLAEIRFPGGMVEPGWRDTFGFLGACQLAQVVGPSELWNECASWARKLLPADYIGDEYRKHASSLLAAAHLNATGRTVRFNGHARSTIYTYRKATLIDMLQITQAEMVRLGALIDEAEKRRRDTEWARKQRRAAGVPLRAEFERAAADRAQQAKALRAEGLSWADVGDRLSITARAARMRASRAR